DFQSAVSPASSRQAFHRRSLRAWKRTICGLEVRDTADWKSAVRGRPAPVTTGDLRITNRRYGNRFLRKIHAQPQKAALGAVDGQLQCHGFSDAVAGGSRPNDETVGVGPRAE